MQVWAAADALSLLKENKEGKKRFHMGKLRTITTQLCVVLILPRGFNGVSVVCSCPLVGESCTVSFLLYSFSLPSIFLPALIYFALILVEFPKYA